MGTYPFNLSYKTDEYIVIKRRIRLSDLWTTSTPWQASCMTSISNRPVILRIFSSKWELIATVSKLSFYQSIWWIEYTVKSLQKSVQGKIGKFMSKLCHAIMRPNFALKLFKVKAFGKQIEKTWAFHWKKY